MAFLILILVLSVLVVVHELGHLLVAKAAGMKVFEFGFGFPPKLVKLFSYRGTDYTLNLIPFGGFVKIAGEDGNDDPSVPSDQLFASKSRFQQFLVLVAGVVGNVLLGLLFIFFILAWGPEQLSIVDAFVQAWQITGQILVDITAALGHLFSGLFQGTADLSGVMGPVGIAGVAKTAVQTGWVSFLSLMAILSLNLAILNLLPIPALDGGRIVVILIESVTKRKLSGKWLSIVYAASFALLILLMILITVHDVKNLF